MLVDFKCLISYTHGLEELKSYPIGFMEYNAYIYFFTYIWLIFDKRCANIQYMVPFWPRQFQSGELGG